LKRINKLHNIFLFFGLCLVLLSTDTALAEGNRQNVVRILFVLDASGSMFNKWGPNNTPRMKTAKKTLTAIVDSVSERKNVQMGLRVYGHQSEPVLRDCEDTNLEVGFGRQSEDYIKSAISRLKPKGITPIAYSLKKAAGDFPNRPGRNIIILITDGEESCGGDPCKISMKLQRKGVVLKNFVIGIGLTDKVERAFNCFASYYSAKDPQSMKKSLHTILSQVLNVTSVQVRLLDGGGSPTVSNVNMTFKDNNTGKARKNLYHTFDNYGNPDTIYLDPVLDYDITAHTLPSIQRTDIELDPKQHNVIDIPAAQGTLNLLMQGKMINKQLRKKLKCVITKQGQDKIINVQQFNTEEKYLTGKYDLELLTLPRQTIPNVRIRDRQETNIQIPAPGIANIRKPYDITGALFVQENGRLRKIYELNQSGKNETLALQPGSYIIIYRASYSTNIHATKMKEFSIRSGRSISLHL